MKLFARRLFLLFFWGGRKKRSLTLLMLASFVFCLLYLSISNLINKEYSSITARSLDRNFGQNSNIKVIVGHYVGGSLGATVTDEQRNANNYRPVKGEGEMGRPVQLLLREVIHARELYSLHGYNILVSDRINVNRTLPDMRSQSCQERQYQLDSLPTACVVVVFHNEAWSALIRTVVSVLTRSPKQLLKEIILVDDASERAYLGAPLDADVAGLDSGQVRVRLLRLRARSGLVSARLAGASNCTAPALVFLDAHTEVTTGWLEPLLDQAGSDDVFVSPHIDLISDETFAYIRSNEMHWGAFSRSLHFRWIAPSQDILKERAKDPSKPYPTPAMAGGLFAVRRSLFWRLGGYDEGMKIWGGENFELSWRAWQCGARLEIAPCSRVGHVFRKHSPYSFPGGVAGTLYNNLARAAAVWMDEWADFYFKFNQHPGVSKELLDIQDRIDLRKRLNCKSFGWYLQNVWPQHYFPAKDRWFGRIKSAKGACLAVGDAADGMQGIGGPASGTNCRGDSLDTLLVYTLDGKIMADEGLCLQDMEGRAFWRACNDSAKQRWKQKGPRLKNIREECLTLESEEVSEKDGVGAPLRNKKCVQSEEQIWKFERVSWR